jgi:hypothetical protein
MGRLLLVSLPATGGAAVYRCKHCDTHLAYATDIISRVGWFGSIGCFLSMPLVDSISPPALLFF